MLANLVTPPTLEPVTLSELKTQLGIDSGTIPTDMTPYVSIPAGSHGAYELMTLDVAPAMAEWAVGDTITGNTSNKTCLIVEILTTKTYIVSGRSGTYTLGEILKNGTPSANADQGTAYPTFNAYIPLGAVASKGTLTLAGIPADGDTVTIGTKTYTWKTALTPTEGQVLIGISAATALDNLKAAINLAGTANIDYKCAAAHSIVTATTNTDTAQVVVALTTGVAGDLIATTDVSANASWGVVTLVGGANGYVDVLGHTSVVYLTPVNNGTGGTVDVKIQECDTPTGTYTDWATGGFTTVTEAIDTAIQEIAYTGAKKYIRTVAKVLEADCEFGTSVMVWEPNVSEDDMLNELIMAGRISVENDTSKKIMEQTWDYFPSKWPDGDRIKIPFGGLQNDATATPSTAVIVTYKKSDWASASDTVTLVNGTDYLVETNGDQCGFIVLPYQGSWPSGELYVSNPISIRFVCGYATALEVPTVFKQAVKKWCVNNYANRGDDVVGQTVTYDKTYDRLINLCGRLFDMDFL